MKYAVEMVLGEMLYIRLFMTIGLGIQVILRLLSVREKEGIYDGLRFYDIHTELSKYRFRCSEFVRGDTQTNIEIHTKRARRFHKPASLLK
jgi:hypothetical protein